MKMCLLDPGLILLCTDLKLCPAAKVVMELKMALIAHLATAASPTGGRPQRRATESITAVAG